MKSYIDIDRLQIFANHGVLERERAIGNRFEVTLRLYYDATEAMQSDEISSALNYAEVVDVVRNEMAKPSDLLEHVAYRIKSALQSRFPIIISGRVTIVKIHPPISTPMSSVAFTVEF